MDVSEDVDPSGMGIGKDFEMGGLRGFCLNPERIIPKRLLAAPSARCLSFPIMFEVRFRLSSGAEDW